MPLGASLNKGNTRAFGGVSNHDVWFPVRLKALKGGDHLRHIVAVALRNLHAESAPFFIQRIGIHDLFCRTGQLQIIFVVDNNKVIQLVVGGDQRGLPVAALRQFAIAGDDKYATRVVIAFRCQRNAYRHGQTMAQRTGIELNTWRLGNAMSKQDEQRLLVKIATLYYSENKKQSEIASLLHLSQSFVSRALTRCQKVAAVVAKFAEVDVAIVGIGELEPSQLLKNSGNYYNETMLQLLAARGAVGDICLHYYDAAGKPVLSQDEDPVIGMELEQIRRCPQVIALAGGGMG